jgi:hypothetical protein
MVENKRAVKQIRCSRYLWLISVIMIGFPAFYLIFAAVIFDLKSQGLLGLILSPLFYLSSFFWIITGFGVRQLKHWSWYTLLGAEFFSTYLNALNLVHYSESQTKGLAFVVTLLIQYFTFRMVANDLRVPYLFPRIKWWESGLAAMAHFPVEVFHVKSSTGTSNGQMLDITLKGCFVKIPAEFEAFEKIKVRISAYGQQLDIPGVVLWHAESTVTHPRGIGIKFSSLDRHKKRRVRVIARKFNKERMKTNVSTPVSA